MQFTLQKHETDMELLYCCVQQHWTSE